MRLMAARATVLLYTSRGKMPIEMREAWTRVLEIAGERDDVQYGLQALWGLWAFTANTVASRMLILAKRFCELAKRSIDPVDLATGDRMLGVTLHYLANKRVPSIPWAEPGPAGSRRPPEHSVHFQYNQSIAARAYAPKILWLQGLPDTAFRAARSVVDDAVAAGHALSLCLALDQAACPVALLVGHIKEAKRLSNSAQYRHDPCDRPLAHRGRLL